MTRDRVEEGLPARPRHDGPWMSETGGRPSDGLSIPSGHHRRSFAHHAAIAVPALVVAADLLFWGYLPGVSLVVFAGLIFTAASLSRGKGGRVIVPALLLLAGALPVIEYPQALSVLILLFALATALACLIPSSPAEIARSAVARLLSMPTAGPKVALVWVQGLGRPRFGSARVSHLLVGWALPVGGAFVLAALLTLSNPIFESWLSGLDDIRPNWGRTVFWIGAACLVWSFLAPCPTISTALFPGLPQRPAIWNARAVGRALVVFNLLLGAQTGLDIVYLWSGAPLPDGITLASYAHRGAYPLLLTTLLAGAFAAAAGPFLKDSPGLRPLVLLWLAQNLALTAAAAKRLDLYVGEFGLTYLRLHAAVWMAVVALGLLFTVWQVARGRSFRWLALRCTALGATTLYLACFVNFGAIIVAANLSLGKLDHSLCAVPHVAQVDLLFRPDPFDCGTGLPHIDGWRDWSFRAWRATRYIASIKAGGAR